MLSRAIPNHYFDPVHHIKILMPDPCDQIENQTSKRRRSLSLLTIYLVKPAAFVVFTLVPFFSVFLAPM